MRIFPRHSFMKSQDVISFKVMRFAFSKILCYLVIINVHRLNTNISLLLYNITINTNIDTYV